MAISGLLLLFFVIGHMLGNLQIFLGRDQINAYGAFLKSQPTLLWMARFMLLGLVILHIASAISLTIQNRVARPIGYRIRQSSGATYASRTMIWSGVIVFAFIVFHLMHFTIGIVDPELLKIEDDSGRHDIYAMVIHGFRSPIVSGFYILSMALLCLHLSHGTSSLFQSLGLTSGNQRIWAKHIASALAWGIFLGNSSIPLAVLMGFGKDV